MTNILKQTHKTLGALAVAALMATSGVSTSFAADWQRYWNNDFGFKVDYPADIFTEIEYLDDGKGLTLLSEDGRAQLNVYTFENEGDLSTKAIMRSIKNGYANKRKITYSRATQRWIVVSGYKRGDNGQRQIFYERLAISRDGDQLSAMEMVYPVAQRRSIDPLLKRLSRSLTAPR